MTSTQISQVLRIGAKAAINKQNWVSSLRSFRLRNEYTGSVREIHESWLIRKIQRCDRWVLWATNKINSLPNE